MAYYNNQYYPETTNVPIPIQNQQMPYNQQPIMQNQMPVGGMPQMQSFVPRTSTTGIIYVQGTAGAQAYYVAPGQSVLLMDANEPIIYFKQTDVSGRPLPILIGDVTFRENGSVEKPEVIQQDLSEYVKKTDIESIVSSSVIKILDEKLGNMQLKVTPQATTGPNFVVN